MAVLIRPGLANAPYRVLADQADVALGTVAGCMSDLDARGLLQKRKDGRRLLAARAQPWALTGADAAGRHTPFFRADETEIYAPARVLEDREAQKALVGQPAARGGNLLVIEPPGPLAIAGETDDDLSVAPGLLAYAELRYRGTGQALEAAELFLPQVLDDAAR